MKNLKVFLIVLVVLASSASMAFSSVGLTDTAKTEITSMKIEQAIYSLAILGGLLGMCVVVSRNFEGA